MEDLGIKDYSQLLPNYEAEELIFIHRKNFMLAGVGVGVPRSKSTAPPVSPLQTAPVPYT